MPPFSAPLKKILLPLLLLMAVSALLLWYHESQQVHTRKVFITDVFVEVKAQGARNRASASIGKAIGELRRIDSRYGYQDSLVDELNRNHTLRDREAYDLIRISREIHVASGGSFSITLRPILDAWGFTGLHPNRIPFTGEFEIWKRSPKDETVRLLGDGMTIEIQPGTFIDIGGLLEGYAVDRAFQAMKDSGTSTGLINVGGEVMAFGNRIWKVGIKNPRGDGLFAVIPLKNKAIATSGDYERFFMQGRQRYCHIIDPSSGWPPEGIMSASVIADTCTQANAWAVALFVRGSDVLGPVLDKKGMDWIVVDREGRIRTSNAMRPYCPERIAAGRPQ